MIILLRNPLTNALRINIITSVVAGGAWCNGNTWVSKTFVEGSNPSAPASKESLKLLRFKDFRLIILITTLSSQPRKKNWFCLYNHKVVKRLGCLEASDQLFFSKARTNCVNGCI